MQKYRSHKVVEAAKILEVHGGEPARTFDLQLGRSGLETVDVEWVDKHAVKGDPDALVGGYFVRYPDGYTSWSPAQAFEEGYTAEAPDGYVRLRAEALGKTFEVDVKETDDPHMRYGAIRALIVVLKGELHREWERDAESEAQRALASGARAAAADQLRSGSGPITAMAEANGLHGVGAGGAVHQPLPVAGYQPQSAGKIAAVNRFKSVEERVLRQLDELRGAPAGDVDQRWLSIGRTSLEQAFMAINRSIFQPGRATLPEEEFAEVLEPSPGAFGVDSHEAYPPGAAWPAERV